MLERKRGVICGCDCIDMLQRRIAGRVFARNHHFGESLVIPEPGWCGFPEGEKTNCGACGKVSLLFGESFPSGGGNPRFLRISTDAAFSSRPFITWSLPTNFTEDPEYCSLFRLRPAAGQLQEEWGEDRNGAVGRWGKHAIENLAAFPSKQQVLGPR
jgi:hypothetical protein